MRVTMHMRRGGVYVYVQKIVRTFSRRCKENSQKEVSQKKYTIDRDQLSKT
jgi:hypothetical protein